MFSLFLGDDPYISHHFTPINLATDIYSWAPPHWMCVVCLPKNEFRPGFCRADPQVIVAVSGFAVGDDAMASAKVDSNVLIGLQGCKDQHLRWGIHWENPKENLSGKIQRPKIKFKFKGLVKQI